MTSRAFVWIAACLLLVATRSYGQAVVTGGGAAATAVGIICDATNPQKVIIVTCPPYNAKGDGSDQTTALQAAANAVPLAGTFYMPCGDYLISSPISFPARVYNANTRGPATHVQGCGSGYDA